MKKSSLLALIGVGVFLINNIYYFILNTFCEEPWELPFYDTIGKIFNFAILIAWILIAQFFYTLYKKSK